MGILEDMGLDFSTPAPDSPALEEFKQGTVPQPGMLESLGFDFESMINQPPTAEAEAKSQDDYLGAMGFDFSGGEHQMPQAESDFAPTEDPELSLSRLGGAFGEGVKDASRSLVDFMQGVNVATNRLKKEIPYYQDDGAMRKFVDFVHKYHPILGPMTSAEFGEGLYRLGRSEVLAADPEYADSSGWLEDVFRAGPNIGVMVLANLVSGGTAGMTTMGMMIAGGTYRNAVEAGTDPEEALAWGLVNAVIQAPLEQLGLTRALKFWKPQSNIVFNIKEIGKLIGTEWLTEFAQSFPDEFINIFSTNPDKKMLDNAAEFISKLGETAKRGAYEGTLTAPWALLTGGAGYAVKKYRKGKPKPSPDTQTAADQTGVGEAPAAPVTTETAAPVAPFQYTTEPYEEFSPADLEALAQMGGREAQIPANMTPEEYTAQLLEHLGNVEFDQEFEQRAAGMKEQQGAGAEAMEAAMAAAEVAEKDKYLEIEFEKRQAEYGKFLKNRKAANKARTQYEKQHRVDRELQQELAERRKSIQEALNFIKSEDMEAVTPRAIPKAQYEKLREALGERVSDFYEADISLIPHGHRAAFALLERQAHEGEPRAETTFDQEGQALRKTSTYPDWFRKKFSAGSKDDYVFSIKEFDNLMHKLRNGLTLTDRQNQMFDHLLEISTEKQQTEPELFQVQDLEALENEGFEVIAGRPIMWGGVGIGGSIVVQDADGSWDDYQMVGEEGDKAIFANETKEFRKPAYDTTSSIVAMRLDDEWIKQRFKEAGPDIFKGPIIMPEEARHHKAPEATAENVAQAPPEAGEAAQAATEAQTPAPQKRPVKERREAPGRPAWDTPFRDEWLRAKDFNEEEFLDYGEKKIADKDSDFLQFAQRLGKVIEEDTPLIEALRIIHARVQAGMTPSKLVSEMTEAEAKKEVLNDWLTGLRNKRAFEQEDVRLKHLVAVDLDVLKWLNDNLGHHVGDAMLILFGDAMRASGLGNSNLYHVSGDEFWMQHDNPGVLSKAIDAIEKYLDENPLTVVYKGVKIPYRLGASYGIGNTLRTAEKQLAAAKIQRESSGKRPERGATPTQILEGVAAGGKIAPAADTGVKKLYPKGLEVMI